MNLYSPPNKGYPQELPNRWRFDDGSVVENLHSLTSTELTSLGWVGPITFLKPFTEKVNEDGEVILDENENPVMEGDYNSETHKVLWYAAQQKFVIVEKDVDEELFGTGENVSSSGKKPDWTTFKSKALASTELNALLGEVLKVSPVVGVTFPVAFFQLENGKYEDFILVWNSILTLVEVSPEFIQEVKMLALFFHLPQEFVDIFSAT